MKIGHTGKIRSEIENKLGRRLTKEEQRDWHTEMGNIKSRKATKGEKNPSRTEDELREAANDALRFWRVNSDFVEKR